MVEDEVAHQLLVKKSLGTHYDLSFATNVTEALEQLGSRPFDFVILDIMLPDGSGFDVVNEMRRTELHHLTPVLFLTVKEDLKSKLLGFALGGDDYMVKPADPLELRARIDAKLRLFAELKAKQNEPQVLVGDFILDPQRQAAWVKDGVKQESIDLTSLEFRLLLYLGRHPDRPIPRDEILKHVWGENTHVLERSVDSYVAALRRKLKSHGRWIEAVHGVGYRFATKPRAGKKAG